MAVQKRGANLFANKGAAAVAEPVENTEAYEEQPDERETHKEQGFTVGKVKARIPLYQYAFIEVEVEGEGAIERAIELTKQYGEKRLQGGASEVLTQAGGTTKQSDEVVMFNGVPVTIPEEHVEALEGAILTDNRGLGVTKNGKKRPDFVWSNGVNQLPMYINTTDFKGNKLATPKLSAGKLQPAYQPRG